MFAISPIDGRYREVTKSLADIFSEGALIKYRIKVELYYLSLLSETVPELKPLPLETANKIVNNLTEDDLYKVKEIEAKTKHDVKAIELFLQSKLESEYHTFIHFGLTSQDINSVVYMMQLYDTISVHISPMINNLIEQINLLSRSSDHPMVCFTHGQPATPSNMRLQLLVFVERLHNLFQELQEIPCRTKFGGATGGFNAHRLAYPDVDWNNFAQTFLKTINPRFQRHKYTTQIDHYDNHSNIYNKMQQISTVLIDFCQDMWLYISKNYFIQQATEDEVGSSTMPHKVNPINFENAEGNLQMTVTLFQLLSRKLPISRLQRDLTDSTVLRNMGVPFAHFFIAVNSLTKGIAKVTLNRSVLKKELDNSPQLLAEGIQTVLRKCGYKNAYDKLKSITRVTNLTRDMLVNFVYSLYIPKEEKQKLIALTTMNY